MTDPDPQSFDKRSVDTDVTIIGGGLAGLCLSVQLAKAGLSVVLLEKEKYPFHKVCGEYISMESWDFLERLGVDLSSMHLPLITNLIVSAPNGKMIRHRLPLGGFGISRYKLDALLAGIAADSGVQVMEESKVTNIDSGDAEFSIKAGDLEIHSGLCAGSFGKRSNLDIKWKRPFVQNKPDKLNNYIAVKYHVRYPLPENTIALHNFKNGYCGISTIEDGKNCLCYLTTAENLHRNKNSIEKLEENILFQNPELLKIFKTAEILYDKPEIISQISFEKKSLVENHILMLGDAAGMITPLCGNGMSMAMHGSKIAAELMIDFFNRKITRQEMENQYEKKWNHEFASRLRTGRRVQSLFGDPFITNAFISFLKPFPFLVDKLISKTHGQPF